MDHRFCTDAPEHLRTMMIEQGKLHLTSQLDLMKGADTRAQGLLTVSATLSGAGLAIAVAHISEPNSPLFVSGACFTLSTFLAALAAIAALWPTGIYAPGFMPKQFNDEVVNKAEKNIVESAIIASIDNRIIENKKVVFWHATRTRVAMLLLGAAPIAGTAGALQATGHLIAGTILAIVAALIPISTVVASIATRPNT